MKFQLKLLFAVEVVVTASLYGIFTYYIIFERLSVGSPFRAYVINIVFMVIVLSLDYILDYTMSQKNFLREEQSKLRKLMAELLFFAHFASYKTALYFFYIVMLIISRVSALEPDLVSSHFVTFIKSVEYGILLLIPLDKLIEQMTKDDRRDKRILKIITRLSKKK